GVFRGEQLVAGYVIHNGPGFYLLDNVPEADRAAWIAVNAASDTCELSMIWRNRGISDVAFALVVWPRIILDCVTNGRRHILGSSYDNPLNQRYQAAQPAMIYAGPSLVHGRQNFIYAYTRPKLVATFFVNFAGKFLGRQRRPA
ncbi:MAG: hypothetical protein JWM80_5861, partial [Cyanobacteria bacterium RYN_339]|nr:hypothetical protein [Cyanobacteria bacterium RYN_339]